jgi:hypothetical protein
LIAGHFQNKDTNTNTMMPISRQMAAILVTGSFIQTPVPARSLADSLLLFRDLEGRLDFSLRRA